MIAFASCLRTVAMLSCNVSETLTISAGAEAEKKATAKHGHSVAAVAKFTTGGQLFTDASLSVCRMWGGQLFTDASVSVCRMWR